MSGSGIENAGEIIEGLFETWRDLAIINALEDGKLSEQERTEIALWEERVAGQERVNSFLGS